MWKADTTGHSRTVSAAAVVQINWLAKRA